MAWVGRVSRSQRVRSIHIGPSRKQHREASGFLAGKGASKEREGVGSPLSKQTVTTIVAAPRVDQPKDVGD